MMFRVKFSKIWILLLTQATVACGPAYPLCAEKDGPEANGGKNPSDPSTCLGAEPSRAPQSGDGSGQGHPEVASESDGGVEPGPESPALKDESNSQSSIRFLKDLDFRVMQQSSGHTGSQREKARGEASSVGGVEGGSPIALPVESGNGFRLEESPSLVDFICLNHTISLRQPIRLFPAKNGENNLFFVWSDNFAGVSAASVWVKYHRLSVNNNWQSSLKSQPVWHDVAGSRWIVSLAQLLQEAGYPSGSVFSEADTQVMEINFTLLNGIKDSIRINFRLRGNLY